MDDPVRDQIESGVIDVRTFDQWSNDGSAAEAIEEFPPCRALFRNGSRMRLLRFATPAAGKSFGSFINLDFGASQSTAIAPLPAREIRTQQHHCCHADGDGLPGEHRRIASRDFETAFKSVAYGAHPG